MRYARAPYLQVLLCALAVTVCGLVSLPFTTMNVCDDGPYIRMAQTFANTGHIVYNGWGAAMMTAQLCLGAIFAKLFGFSTTSVRMSTLLIAAMAAVVFHRTLVRAGSSERNATLATLAAVISPMYLMLSVTFMTDIAGFFAVMLCLYGCVRALQASTDRSAIAWIWFAVVTCAVFGTSRQIAWLGDLVMVPCTLWLLRSRSRIRFAGAVAFVVSCVFILGCMHWLAKQPYAVPVPLIVRPFPTRVALGQLSDIFFELPFLVLPVVAAFGPRVFRSPPFVRSLLLAALVAYVGLALLGLKIRHTAVHLEPTAGHMGSWINVYGAYTVLPGTPVMLHTNILILLTIVCIGGLLGVVAVVLQVGRTKASRPAGAEVLSWKQLGILLLPFSCAYLILLAATVGTTYNIFDRYGIGLLGPIMIVLVRLYQQEVQPNLPFATIPLIIIMGAWGMIATHNTFALDRARVDLANELHANGVPFTSIDGTWDFNLDTELQNSNHINNPLIKVPAHSYVPPAPAPPGYCEGFWHDRTPHVHAIYGISFFPDSCHGPAPFAPVQYRPWPFRTPVNLYAVRYAPPSQH